MLARSKTYQHGLLAERLAGAVLRLKGYRIISQRLKTPVGEIDLVAKRGKTLVIAEVKQRRTMAEAAAAISVRQRERLVMAARFMLAQRPELSDHTVRFDAILVGRWWWPTHIESAWSDETTR